jgi:hypothetical protein
MSETLTALLAALGRTMKADVEAATDAELSRLAYELETITLFVRHERQRREENAE